MALPLAISVVRSPTNPSPIAQPNARSFTSVSLADRRRERSLVGAMVTGRQRFSSPATRPAGHQVERVSLETDKLPLALVLVMPKIRE